MDAIKVALCPACGGCPAVEITEEGADAHIDKQAKRYLNLDKYPYRTPSEVRVLYKILPERSSSMG